jgi:hypothetical protein
MNLQHVLAGARSRGNLGDVLGLLRSASAAAEWHERVNAALQGVARLPDGWWTFERCKESALKYKSRWAWGQGDLRAYAYARKHGWLDACVAHMKPVPVACTKEECLASARRFKTRKAWQLGDCRAYAAARKNGWYDECCECLPLPVTCLTLTRKECIASARRFTKCKAWEKADRSAYTAAKRNGWYAACVAHIGPPRSAWTLEACKASARQFKTRHAWEKGGKGAYTAAKHHRWFDECVAHMGPPLRAPGSRKAKP